jgi:hypothetical protein
MNVDGIAEQSRGSAEWVRSSSYEVDDASHATARLNDRLICVASRVL